MMFALKGWHTAFDVMLQSALYVGVLLLLPLIWSTPSKYIILTLK